MENWAAVVLAAGKGTRMRSKLPKVLHALCGRPMAAHVVDAARQSGVGAVVVVVSAGADEVREALGDAVAYAVQREPQGTGHALAAARAALDGRAAHLLVVNGDMPLVRPRTLRAMMQAHRASGAAVTVLAAAGAPIDAPARIVRDESGAVAGVVEQAELSEGQRSIREVNCGAYCFDAAWLWPSLGELRPGKKGELYLTSLVAMARGAGRAAHAVPLDDPAEALGVDTRILLAEAEAVMRRRIRERWMAEGVTLIDPASIYIDAGATIGKDTVLYPNTFVLGASAVGEDSEIGPGTMLRNARTGDRCRVLLSVIEDSTLEHDVAVGPYSHLRGDTYIESGVHLGNFVEIKKSRLGSGTRSHHFSYLGDATIGKDVNIGAGSITCNFDGVNKLPTVIEEGAFVGCDTMLVAPVRVGARAKTGAGAVVTRDVESGTVVVGVPARPLSSATGQAKAAPQPATKKPRRSAKGRG